MGSAYADLDNDGDLDLVVNNLNAPASILKNNASQESKNNYLKVQLKGSGENTFGMVARVEVFWADQKNAQELSPVRGWLSASDYQLVFGLGEQPAVDSVVVWWPSGKKQNLEKVPTNQTLVLEEKNAQNTRRKESKQATRFENITATSGLAFQHQENPFIDFTQELLLPHKLSNVGPRMAIADVNGDDLQDLFIGGAAGQSGALFVQNSKGFTRQQSDIFQKDADKEDVDAAFFDADQDGDLDLYVVSGGGQWVDPALTAYRLYLNDGTGQFNLAPDFTAPTSNGSSVVAADFNQDGLTDPLLTYYRQDKEWLFNGLDEVKKQIPPIRVKYPTYDKYAEHSVSQFFSQAQMDTVQFLRAETFASSLIVNEGAGNYTIHALPEAAQTAPVYAFWADDFNEDLQIDVLAMGNNSGNTPSIGNQMASLGYYLEGLGQHQFALMPNTKIGLHVKGEVRDIQSVQVGQQTWWLIAKNNANLEIIRLSQNEEKQNAHLY